MRWKGITLLVAVSVAAVSAQETVQPRRGADRALSTREFLGLGPAPDPAAAARGEKVFVANCAICHGAKATGATATNLVRSAFVLHDEKGDQIAAVIQRGRPEGGMPAFPNLTADQRAEIHQFLRLRIEQVANRGAYQRANVVTGDAKQGEAYFNGAGRCNTCHSVTGDLAHVGSKYRLPDQLQSRFLYPGGPGAVRRAKITLPSGETITGPIKRIDDFSISITDSAGNYRSWDRDGVRVEIEDPLAAHKELAAKYTDAEMHNLTAYLVTLR